MKRFTAIKEIEIDYGHRIKDHGSCCSQLHGHRGKIEVHVSGPLQTEGSSNGMVLDFQDIKIVLYKLHDKWDHGLLLEKGDPLLGIIDDCYVENRPKMGFGKVFVLDFPPTAENLAEFAFNFLCKELETRDITVNKVVFWETPTSRAVVEAPSVVEDVVAKMYTTGGLK